MTDFIMEYIIGPFLSLLVVCVVLGIVIGIPIMIKNENETSKKVEACFMQKPRTDDCEFLLWKYELSKKQPRHTTTAVPVFMQIRH